MRRKSFKHYFIASWLSLQNVSCIAIIILVWEPENKIDLNYGKVAWMWKQQHLVCILTDNFFEGLYDSHI